MIQRHLEKALAASAKQYPVITVTGPRQSGKTTLARAFFKKHEYVSLENPDDRAFALEDPRGFLNRFKGCVILDEVQQSPDLLSYIQGIVDNEERPGRFILTGSQNLLLLQKVSQSLAGRTAVFHLLPFSHGELIGREPMLLKDIGHKVPRSQLTDMNLFKMLFTGFYPRIHDKGLEPQVWLRNYYQTYIERDVRNMLNVDDINTFGKFVRLCARRAGQLLNLSSLGADCGVSHATARRWLSLLEASFIIYLLRPYHQNFSKRLIKSPKLYFLDTGLLCYLLRIQSAQELLTHFSRGAIFETFALTELLKSCMNRGIDPDIYFWRDSAGHEIDFLLDLGHTLVPVEAKSGETVGSDFFKGLDYWRTLPGQKDAPVALLYGGATSVMRKSVAVYSWQHWL